MRVLFYVSGHGYGHATRVTAVMNALRERRADVRLYVRTEAPVWVFRTSVAGPVCYEKVRLDAGMIERDLLAQDPRSTLHRCREVYSTAGDLLRGERTFVEQERIDCIVSDIPPLGSAVGREAGVPVVALGNFSWDYIYAPFTSEFPDFAPVIRQIRECYASTDLLLRLPWCHEMDAFPRRVDIPLVTRRPITSRQETRAELAAAGVNLRRPLILLGGRFPGVGAGALEPVLRSRKYTLLAFGDFGVPESAEFVRLPEAWQPRFLDVLQAADAVVSKIGYGIAAECVSCRTPILYPPRENFAEHPIVEAGLAKWVPTQRIERREFERGDWAEPLEQLLARPFAWPEVPVNGAEVAAEHILCVAGGSDRE